MVSSPVFCYLQLSGMSMIYTSVLLYLGKPNVGKCIAVALLMVVGFVLVIGSLIAKNYRYTFINIDYNRPAANIF